jgi:hypothetical protein
LVLASFIRYAMGVAAIAFLLAFKQLFQPGVQEASAERNELSDIKQRVSDIQERVAIVEGLIQLLAPGGSKSDADRDLVTSLLTSPWSGPVVLLLGIVFSGSASLLGIS